MRRMIVLSLGLMLGWMDTVSAGDWPKFLGPTGDNHAAEGAIAKSFGESGPKVEWRADVNEGYGGAAIAGGEVFLVDRVPGEKDVLLCLDIANGREKWRWELEVAGRISHPGSRVVPTVEADAVYASSGFGHAYCIDRETHEPRWVVDVATEFGAQPPRFGWSIHPVVMEDRVIIAPTAESAGLAALDKATGEVVWRSEPIVASQSSPILVELVGREMLVMPSSDRGEARVHLTAYDPATGETIFEFTDEINRGVHNSIPSITVLDEDSFVLTGGYNQGTQFVELTEADGAITATLAREVPSGAMIHPVLRAGDLLYMTVDERRGRGADGPFGLVCMDLEGNTLWSTSDSPEYGTGSLILAGGTIVSQDGDDGTLRLIEPGAEYKVLAEGKVFEKETGEELWAPMALGGTRLLMRSQHELVCIDLTP